MKAYTIKKKDIGTGSVHDIASDQFDREICFTGGTRYAVILEPQYGGRGYTTYKTAASAAKMSYRQTRAGYNNVVIDYRGNTYTSNGWTLVAD